VSQTGTRAPDFQQVNTYGSCLPGYTALSGGVYLSMPDDSEVPNGFLDYSILANGNRWYVDGSPSGTPPTSWSRWSNLPPARTGGGGVTQALNERPSQAVTPALAESQPRQKDAR
jgi:hypothetical protein